MRICTNPKVFSPPTSPSDAISAIEALLRHKNCVLVEPGPHHLQHLLLQLNETKLAGPETTDAVFAALALEKGATLVSTDRGFRRFPKLKQLDPTR